MTNPTINFFRIVYASALILTSAFAAAQNSNKYREVDALIETNQLIDAMNALDKLKTVFRSDTLSAEYWVRYSKAANGFFKSQEAKESIKKAISIQPKNPEYYYEKGILYNSLGELDSAKTALNRAILIRQSGKYFYWRGIVNQQQGRLKDAEEDYQKALNEKFETPELCNNLAILVADDGRYEEALNIVNRGLSINDKFTSLYSVRSKINLFLMNFDAACKDLSILMERGYRKALEIPDSICNGSIQHRLHFVGDALSASKQYKQAILAYTRLIDLKQLKSDYFLNRGYCYYQLKDLAAAEMDYLKALSLSNPAEDLLYDNLSLLYYDQYKFEKSVEYATKRILLNPKNHVAFLDRGLSYRKWKKFKEAEKDFNTSLEIKPDFFRAFGYRAFLYLELGQYNKSYDDASTAVKIKKDYGYAYMVLAQAKQKLGMPDFCVDWYSAKQYGEKEAASAITEYCK